VRGAGTGVTFRPTWTVITRAFGGGCAAARAADLAARALAMRSAVAGSLSAGATEACGGVVAATEACGGIGSGVVLMVC
jgi:hypothetical protein